MSEEINLQNSKSTNGESYFTELKKIRRLSESEKRVVIAEYYSNSELDAKYKIQLRNVLISDHLLLVLSQVMKKFNIKPNNHLFKDLVQEGNKGLVYGIDRFDLSVSEQTGKTLASYLIYWIDAYIYDFLVRNHRLIRIKNGNQRRFYFKMAKAKAKLLRELKDESLISYKLLSQELNLDEKVVIEMSSRLAPDAELSLHQQVGQLDSGRELQDVLPDDRDLSDQAIQDYEFEAIVREEMLKLRSEEFTNFTREKKRAIIDYCFLPSIDSSFSQKEIKELAEMWQEDEERVRGLKRELAESLRLRLIARFGKKEEFQFLCKKIAKKI